MLHLELRPTGDTDQGDDVLEVRTGNSLLVALQSEQAAAARADLTKAVAEVNARQQAAAFARTSGISWRPMTDVVARSAWNTSAEAGWTMSSK
jgi:hypothetical protein